MADLRRILRTAERRHRRTLFVVALSKSAPDKAAAAAAGGEGRQLIRAIADLVALVEPQLLSLWRATGMTLAQRRLLRRLRSGERTAGQLAQELGMSAPSTARMIARLEARGLLSRRLDESDRRRVVVALAPPGESALADHRVFHGTPLASAARSLPETQRRRLAEDLAELTSRARSLSRGRDQEETE